MPRDFFQYLIEVCRVIIATVLAGGFDEGLRLFRTRNRLLHLLCTVARMRFARSASVRLVFLAGIGGASLREFSTNIILSWKFLVRSIDLTLTEITSRPYKGVMTSNFVSSLKAEITELEAELRDDPRQRKLARLRAALAEYEPVAMTLASGSSSGGGGSFGLSASGGSSSFVASTTMRTKGDKIKAEITALLQQRAAVHRKEILSHLTTVGLMGHEKDPMASLAAYFSGWRDIFGPDGRGNWSLIEGLKAAE